MGNALCAALRNVDAPLWCQNRVGVDGAIDPFFETVEFIAEKNTKLLASDWGKF